MKLSITIMAHPHRKPLVKKLIADLGEYTPIAWDRNNDRWNTGKLALNLHKSSGSDYSLVLQDDAVIPPGFKQGVVNALRNVPEDSPLVLYATRTRAWSPILNPIPETVSYLIMERIWWGVGVVYPTHLIPPMIRYSDAFSQTAQYDHRASAYFELYRIPVYYTWPNLVNHQITPSLIKGRSGRRQAHNYVGGSADKVDWSGGAVKVEPPQ